MNDIDTLVGRIICEVWHEEMSKNSPNATPHKYPLAFVLGGQPGAGKSRLILKVKHTLNDNVIVINGDDLRKYHPSYFEFQKIYRQESPKYTAKFAGKLTEAILKKAINERYNIVIEGTFRTAKTPIATLQKLKANGYKTAVLIQTCHKKVSWSSCLERYENMLKINPHEARYTDKAHHDLVTQNLAKNIKDVQNSSFADSVEIFERKVAENGNKFTQHLIYSSENGDKLDVEKLEQIINS